MEEQISNNNVNAGGSFIEAGLQQVKTYALSAWLRMSVTSSRRSSPPRTAPHYGSKTSPFVSQGPKIRLGRNGKATHCAGGRIIDNDDVVEGIVLLRKGAESDSTLDAIHAKVKELERPHSAPRCEGRSIPRSQ